MLRCAYHLGAYGVRLPFAVAASSVVSALERGWRARHDGDLDEVEFTLGSPATLKDGLDKVVTILPYRIDLDARRTVPVAPATPGGPPRRSLAMEMRFLLIAWFTDAERELQVLGACVEILDETPVLGGPLIEAEGAPPDLQLVVSLDAIPGEDLYRLWDALAPSYRLSVPYVVRTIRLGARTLSDAPPVDAVARGYRPSARR